MKEFIKTETTLNSKDKNTSMQNFFPQKLSYFIGKSCIKKGLSYA